MAISGIGSSTGASSIAPIEIPKVDSTDKTKSSSFGDSMTNAVDSLQETQTKADDLSMQVATGKLTNIHDYMISATQAELSTQLTVAVKNKGVEAFNQIMNMSV